MSSKMLSQMKCGFNSLKSLCKSFDKIKSIFTQNNSVLCEAIECQINCYLDMNFTIDLNLCKISHKMLSNHNTINTLNTYYRCFWPKCLYKTSIKTNLISHQLIHSSIKQFKCDFNNCNKVYTSKCALFSHKTSVHSNVRYV